MELCNQLVLFLFLELLYFEMRAYKWQSDSQGHPSKALISPFSYIAQPMKTTASLKDSWQLLCIENLLAHYFSLSSLIQRTLPPEIFFRQKYNPQ